MESPAMLPDTTHLGAVDLRVCDLAAALTVWRDVLGLAEIGREVESVTLGCGGKALVLLHSGATAPAPSPVVGLFHVAVHVPTRVDLAQCLARMRAARQPHSGQDHLFSESLYMSDPSGNGIEIALDTPGRGEGVLVDGEWQAHTHDGKPHSMLEPLDLAALLAELPPGASPAVQLPDASIIGHIHFRTDRREAVFAFYRDVIGFRPRVNSAAWRFCDVGTALRGHMVAFNTWGGEGLAHAAPTAPGVIRYRVLVPDAGAIAALTQRLAAAGVAHQATGTTVACADPQGNRIVVMVG